MKTYVLKYLCQESNPHDRRQEDVICLEVPYKEACEPLYMIFVACNWSRRWWVEKCTGCRSALRPQAARSSLERSGMGRHHALLCWGSLKGWGRWFSCLCTEAGVSRPLGGGGGRVSTFNRNYHPGLANVIIALVRPAPASSLDNVGCINLDCIPYCRRGHIAITLKHRWPDWLV